MLAIRNFSKSYGNHHVLAIPELTLAPGLYWIHGANGSGKTSLFKSLAGILPHQGDIDLNDVNLRRDPVAYRLLVNYCEAEPFYPTFLTAKDLIRFIGAAKKVTLQQQNALTIAWGVDTFMNDTIATYSSGMVKKVSLVTAFLGNPKLFILDEPFITLDRQARELLFTSIRQALDDGAIGLISSHQPFDESGLVVRQAFSIQDKTLVPT